jgi:RND family efflux transporter MFP subunit
MSFAGKELKRISDLRAQFLATNAEVQTAAQNLGKAKIKLNALLSQQKGGAILNADFLGTIITVNIQAGQVIQANSTLLSYSKGNDREIRLGVDVEDLHSLKNGQDVIIYSLVNEQLHQSSNIKNITGQVDPSTGLIDVVVRLSNAPAFIPGSLVRGEIVTQKKIKQITVPRSAVLYQQNRPYVFVVVNGKAHQRFISVDEDNGQVVSIKQGLHVNEKVVQLGNYELKEGMSVVEQN